ncbi:cbb3-type cytochrome oxidase assembly protein CcoS [Candidatus Accumulibacter contiguus]|uniref:cbb3-type cytochrome oxidase assembly protein CcoS n=1 Tax=Candidatus Accumulibacter contiguus TaxID=2954381 RepID=UPI00207BAE01|nr:cbb3-type cytochrome oxidase assembly protein CcoS [Candidatus Accumulibacter contiguus]
MTETLYLLIPISVVLVFLIAIAFWWSLRNGQFDDLEGPAYRILMDDDSASAQSSQSSQASEPLADGEPGAPPRDSSRPASAVNLRDS